MEWSNLLSKRGNKKCKNKIVSAFGTVANSIQAGDKFQLTDIGLRATPYFKLITSEQEQINKARLENTKKSKTKWESFDTIQEHESKMFNKLSSKFSTNDEIKLHQNTNITNCRYDKKFSSLLRNIVNIGNRKVESHLNMLEFNNGKYQLKQRFNSVSKHINNNN